VADLTTRRYIERLDNEGAHLIPALEEVFDAVLGESDETCSSIKKMRAYLSR